MIKLHNTKTRAKEIFTPIDDRECADVCLRPDGL